MLPVVSQGGVKMAKIRGGEVVDEVFVSVLYFLDAKVVADLLKELGGLVTCAHQRGFH